MKESGPSLYVSVRANTPREEYDTRKAADRLPRKREGDEPPVVNDESWPNEPGYVVRQRGGDGVRAELVRLHGREMLIVRAVWKNPKPPLSSPLGHPGQRVAYCERIARLIQDYEVQKLGWRE